MPVPGARAVRERRRWPSGRRGRVMSTETSTAPAGQRDGDPMAGGGRRRRVITASGDGDGLVSPGQVAACRRLAALDGAGLALGDLAPRAIVGRGDPLAVARRLGGLASGGGRARARRGGAGEPPAGRAPGARAGCWRR